MSIAELLKPAAGLTPEERYVLVRMAFRAHAAEPLDVGSKVLAKDFGMPDAAFTKAKDGLIQHEILFESSLVASRGRPKTLLKWTEQWGHELMTELVARSPHLDVISTMLSSCSRSSLPGKINGDRMAMVRDARSSEKVSFVNCLLLAVLWALADDFGVVEGVGAKQLSTLTGLDKERLKHRLGRLMDQGFIWQYVPGGYSRMLGGRSESVYALNTNHPVLSQVKRRPERADFISASAAFAGRTFWSWTQQELQELVVRLDKEPWHYDFSPIQRYLWIVRRDESDAYFRLLPLILTEYVQMALSAGLQPLGRSRILRLLKEHISRDFCVPVSSGDSSWERLRQRGRVNESALEPNLLPGSDHDRSAGKEGSDLELVICGYVLKMADWVRENTGSMRASDWARCRILWLTHSRGSEGFSVIRSAA